jgi:hypothetical protein
VVAELEVQVVDQDIIVNLPGTRFTITFRKDPESPNLTEQTEWTQADPEGGSLALFRARAWEAADQKARELGWIV